MHVALIGLAGGQKSKLSKVFEILQIMICVKDLVSDELLADQQW